MVLKLGSKGNAVAKLQIALKNKGYNLSVDESYGKVTEAAVMGFQRAKGLVVDGIAGPQTQGELFKQTKGRYSIKNGVHCIELDPLDLKLHMEVSSGKGIKLANFMNASYVWWTDKKKTKAYPTSLLIYNGRVVSKNQPNGHPWQKEPHYENGAPTPTFIIYKNGEVEVKKANINSISKEEVKSIHLAVSGINLLPYVDKDGFDPYVPFGTVAYRTNRIAIGYSRKTKKVKLCYHKNADASQMRVHMRNAGCDEAISLDSGGSANFSPANKTTRIMCAWITW